MEFVKNVVLEIMSICSNSAEAVVILGFVTAAATVVLAGIWFALWRSEGRNQEGETFPQRVPGPPYMLGIGAVVTYCRFLLMGIPEATSYYGLKYGDFVRIWIAGTPTYLITRPSVASYVLKSNNYTLRFGDATGLSHIGMFRNGIIWNTDVGNWKSLRSHFQKALNAFTLKECVNVATSATDRILSQVPKLQQREKDGRIEALNLLRRITLDVVNNLTLKADIDDDEDLIERIVSFFKAWEYFLIKPPWTYSFFKGFRKHIKSIKSVNDAINKLIEKKRMEVKDVDLSCPVEGDFVETLLRDEMRHVVSEDDVRQCVVEMIVAGTDTSSVTMYYMLVALFNHPGVEGKLLAELQSVLGDRPVTWHDLPKLVNLENALKESMRIRPVGPVILRRAMADDTLGAYLTPKGTQIILNLAQMHRRPDIFADPDVFNPDRFSNKDMQHEYFPFGTGPKGCIGQFMAMVEMKAIMATFLRQYKAVPCEYETLETLETRWDIAQQPQKPSYMYFVRRDQ